MVLMCCPVSLIVVLLVGQVGLKNVLLGRPPRGAHGCSGGSDLAVAGAALFWVVGLAHSPPHSAVD